MTQPQPPTQAAAIDPPLAPGLYLVATPIGNLEDITLRALRVLRSADRIACEDTRQTQKLLHHFGIRKPTVSYHLHNEEGRASELVRELQAGGRIALVSDAGTPGIADPGEALVREALAVGIAVHAIPGANAALSALVSSGLSAEAFSFHGFLPSRAGQRKTTLEALHAQIAGSPQPTQIFYESPHRIAESLADVESVFGRNHKIVLARELTKLHEELLRGTVAEVRLELGGRDVIRGEIVLLLDGRKPIDPQADTANTSPVSLATEMQQLIRSGLTEKDALKQAARTRGLGKSELYREWQRLRR